MYMTVSLIQVCSSEIQSQPGLNTVAAQMLKAFTPVVVLIMSVCWQRYSWDRDCDVQVVFAVERPSRRVVFSVAMICLGTGESECTNKAYTAVQRWQA